MKHASFLIYFWCLFEFYFGVVTDLLSFCLFSAPSMFTLWVCFSLLLSGCVLPDHSFHLLLTHVAQTFPSMTLTTPESLKYSSCMLNCVKALALIRKYYVTIATVINSGSEDLQWFLTQTEIHLNRQQEVTFLASILLGATCITIFTCGNHTLTFCATCKTKLRKVYFFQTNVHIVKTRISILCKEPLT